MFGCENKQNYEGKTKKNIKYIAFKAETTTFTWYSHMC